MTGTTGARMSEANTGRRRVPRVVASGEAVLGGRRRRVVGLRDLSTRGCLVRSERRLAPGQILDLALELGGQALRLKARVAEVSVDGVERALPRYLAGLEFLGVKPADERRLERFVEAERRRQARA